MKKDDESVFSLFMSNFMAFFWFQLFFSIGMITLYAMLAVVMPHNECRYDHEGDDEGLKNNPEEYPNVTSTLTLIFLGGLGLHVLLFAMETFVEPFWRYYFALNKEEPAGFMQQTDELARKEAAL